MKNTTIAKPTNGQRGQNKPRVAAKGKPSNIGLRRLTKRQRERIYRIFTLLFLVIFAISIVGGLIALTVKAPAGH